MAGLGRPHRRGPDLNTGCCGRPDGREEPKVPNAAQRLNVRSDRRELIGNVRYDFTLLTVFREDAPRSFGCGVVHGNKFTQFLRSGGSGGFVLSRNTRGMVARPISRKADIPGLAALQQQFATNLDFADQINVDLLLRFTRDEFDSPLSASDLEDVSGDKAAAIQAWSERVETIWADHGERPSRFNSLRRAMEENLITSFSGLISERRQRALGIDQYIWRSRDDAKVRHTHAEHDDKVSDWDNPPESGHPGQAYNCRCFAEPNLIDEPKCEPDFVAAQVAHGRGVDAGVWEAIKDTLTDIAQTLSEIPENLV